MAELFSDDFTRSNEELGASADWTERNGDYEIVSNQAKAIAVSGSEALLAHTGTSPITTADYEVIAPVDVTGIPGGYFAGIGGRRVNYSTVDSDGYFLLRYQNGASDDLRLYKRVSGSWTQLGSSYSATASGSETLKLVMDGSDISGYLDGTLRIGPITDTSLTASGDCCITDATGTPDHSGAIWDSFTVNDLVTAIDLVIQDAAHAHSVDNVSLIQEHVLSINDSLHNHLSDVIELVQEHVLAINDASHSHISDVVMLTQDHVLVINESLHSHKADNITLSIPTGAITPSSRIFIIEQDNRVYVVAKDDRICTILEENRIYPIH